MASTLPEIRHKSELLVPIPITAKIEAATAALRSVLDSSVRCIVLVRDEFVINCDSAVIENASHALTFGGSVHNHIFSRLPVT